MQGANVFSADAASSLTVALERIDDVELLAGQWRELENRAECSFFLTWDWIGTWLATETSPPPLVLSVRDSGTLVGLAILHTARLRRRFMPCNVLTLNRTGDPYRDLINIEYNNILMDHRYAKVIWPSVLVFLKRVNLPDAPFRNWDELHLAMATNEVEPVAREAGLMVLELAHKTSWFVDLQAVREGNKPYLDTLSSNARYQIRRAMRLYEKEGQLVGESAKSPDQAMAFFAELKDLHQAYWVQRGMPGGFSNNYFENFHRTLLRNCLERGTVEIFRVSAGSRLIGQVYNFIHRGRVHAYQTGFAYDDDPKAKPGLVSHYLCLQQHLNAGRQVYDFMAGDNRYKQTLGARGPDMAFYAFQRKTAVRMVESFLRRMKQLADL